MSYIDLTGKTFGQWTVLSRTARKKTVYYLCRCACGSTREVLSVSLRNGKSTSCGCLHREDIGARSATHGMQGTPTHNSWVGMKQRCNYPGHSEYHRYGGRGITFDPRWNDFAAFLADMGTKPPGTSLDRIDNDGHYCRANCRWATREQQSSNTIKNIFVEWRGQRYTLMQLATHLNVNYDLLHKWHRTNGLPLDEAVRRASA